MNYITLNNGVEMPAVGYGVYQVSPDECVRCVEDALHAGYRLIDTAQSYDNEYEVGPVSYTHLDVYKRQESAFVHYAQFPIHLSPVSDWHGPFFGGFKRRQIQGF